MKIALLPVVVFLFAGCKSHPSDMHTGNFNSQRFSKTETIAINGEIENIFPLFGAFEEKKWAEGWHPVLIYPSSEKMEEWLTFKTPAHVPGEMESTWIVLKYQPENYFVQYLVLASNRYLTISIKCNRVANKTTAAEITYMATGLDNSGNEMGEHNIKKIYAQSLKDWKEAIEYYLKTGRTLR